MAEALVVGGLIGALAVFLVWRYWRPRQLPQSLLPTSTGPVSIEELRHMTFPAPPMGKRGYNTDEVDELLAGAADALAGHGTMSAADVAGVCFNKPPLGQRGYDEDEVDAFLDRLTATFTARRSR